MASSIISATVTVSSLLASCAVALLLLRRYLPLRSTPAFLILPVFLAVALPASAIILLPIDLASSARTEDETTKGVWLPDRAVLVLWRIIYWLTFMLTWVILPLLGEFMDAGYRDPMARAKYSLRSNGRYQMIVLASSTGGLVYVSLSHGFDFTAIKGLVMALAYVWGLVLAIYLMGHGLVAIPRRRFQNADIAARLRRVQARAPAVHDKLEDAIIALENIELQTRQLQRRKTGTAREFQVWIDELAEQTGQVPGRVTLATPSLDAAQIPNVITERYLADVSRRLARARHQRVRYIQEWDDIVRSASDLQAMIDSKSSKQLIFARAPSSVLGRYSPLTPHLRYRLHIHVYPALQILAGILLSLASAAVVWSEIIRVLAPQLSAVSLTVIHHPSSPSYQIGLGGQLLAACWVLYMVFCTLSSLTVIPTWNQRALVKRNTHAESATWYASQTARLTVPLTYNFLTFLPKHIREQTTFHSFLGRLIELTPLGDWFNFLFPIFILFPVCATLFNLYGRIKRVLGLEIIEDSAEPDHTSAFGGWREGRDLIARDLNGPTSDPSAIGLTRSPRTSADIAGTGRGAPTLWVPPSERSSSPIRQSIRTSSTFSHAPRHRPGQAVPLPEPEDDQNFFTLLGNRVKNTFENIETPKWMQNDSTHARASSGPFKFTKPKWMGSQDQDRDQGTSTGGARGNDNFFHRMFDTSSRNAPGGGGIVL